MDRRVFLTGLGSTVAGTSSLMAASAATPPLRIRKSVSDLPADHPDLAALRKAIPLMRRSGDWEAQIAIHADMNQRHHSSWRFLPWHRMQLVWFERQVAQLSGYRDFALPYWDWDSDRIPVVMLDDPTLSLPGREAGPDDRVSTFMRSNGQSYTGRVTDDFSTFFGRARNQNGAGGEYYSGSGEWSGHNLIHGFVGGDMGRLDRSPNDPLFWMHHANIDRIWTVWRDQNPQEICPKPWRDEVISGFVDANGRQAPSTTAAQTLNTSSFGYGYGVDPTPPIVFAVAPRRRLQDLSSSWLMQQTGPQSGFIDIPKGLAAAQKASAVGYLDVSPDPNAGSVIRLTAKTPDSGTLIYSDAVVLVPMVGCAAQQGHRINLDRLWNGGSDQDVRLSVEVTPLAGRGRGTTATRLLQFVIDADPTFFE